MFRELWRGVRVLTVMGPHVDTHRPSLNRILEQEGELAG